MHSVITYICLNAELEVNSKNHKSSLLIASLAVSLIHICIVSKVYRQETLLEADSKVFIINNDNQ